ncbi:MAG TPA: competence/damage-inducible protein A [bacterium]|nr:competence/damage-inducible protein A [bacterium]
MRAEIISVGTELLLGQILDSNASYLAQQLAELGVDVHFKQTVGDNDTRVRDAVRLALSRADVLLITGGLGPTEDDLTVASVAGELGRPLERHDDIAERLRQFFTHRGRVPSDNVFKQALIPSGAHPIPNTRGTAPGIHIEHNGRELFLMPGVPFEMYGMMECYVIPRLRERTGGVVIRSRVIRVTGEGESAVEARIKDLIGGNSPTIAPYAKLGEVHLRVTAKGASDDVARQLDAGERALRERLTDLIYGIDEDTLEGVVGRLLTDRGVTLAVAESCTGGLIAKRLTDVSGSSAYFLEGIVAYSNDAKRDLLSVQSSVIEEYGAVSAEVAEAMARGVRERAGSTLGLSVTGIAGPDGGTATKPVGLVFLGLATRDQVQHRRLNLGVEAGRAGIRSLAAQAGLNLLRLRLLRNDA